MSSALAFSRGLCLALLLLTGNPVAGHRAPCLTVCLNDAWSRPALDLAVVYVQVQNASPLPQWLDRVSTPLGLATLHATTNSKTAAVGQGMAEMPAMTMTQMHAVDEIRFAPGHGMRFGPGGYHIMVSGLHHPLARGEHFLLRVHFEPAGWQSITVHVR